MTENIEMKRDDAQNGGWGRAKKILKRVGWVLLGLLAVMWAIGFFAPEFTEAIPERLPAWIQGKIEARKQATLDAEIDKIREKYKNDLDGGKTPEETLDLFIEALKAGDIEKASKYYELSVQGNALASLKEEMSKQGDLHQSIKYFSDVRGSNDKICNKEYTGCGFEYNYFTEKDETVPFGKAGDMLFVPAGSESSKFTDVGLNPYSKVWKIKQPY